VAAGQESEQDFSIEGPLTNFEISFDVHSEGEVKIKFRRIDV